MTCKPLVSLGTSFFYYTMKAYFKVMSNDKIFSVGSLEANFDVVFIMLKNYGPSNNHFEKVMMFINMTRSSDDIKMEII